MKKIYCFLVIALLLSGCSSNNAKVNVNNAAKEDQPTPQMTSSVLNSESTTDKIWEDFAERSSLNFSVQEPDLYLFYIDGLKNKSDYVRWFSAYKIIEYCWDEQRKTEITELLNKLSNDKADYVKHAAIFSLSVVNNKFDKDVFKKSPDGNYFIFSRFYESRYNEGEIWIYSKQQDFYKLFEKINGGSYDEVFWAPDSKKACVLFSGRTWIDVGILDIDMYSVEHQFVSPEISSYISKNKKALGYKIDQNQRPDFYIKFLEWKEDSTKILLSYNFTDDDFAEQSGIVVYDIEKCQIERLEKNDPGYDMRPSAKKPSGFKW